MSAQEFLLYLLLSVKLRCVQPSRFSSVNSFYSCFCANLCFIISFPFLIRIFVRVCASVIALAKTFLCGVLALPSFPTLLKRHACTERVAGVDVSENPFVHFPFFPSVFPFSFFLSFRSFFFVSSFRITDALFSFLSFLSRSRFVFCPSSFCLLPGACQTGFVEQCLGGCAHGRDLRSQRSATARRVKGRQETKLRREA